MTVEFIQKRIEGKKAEVAKLEKKLARIMKAKESNWEVNPYYYHEDDIKWTTRDLEQAKASLSEYETALERENEKAGSRNIQVIIDFLNDWKIKVFNYYKDSYPKYKEAEAEYFKASHAHTDWFNNQSWKLRREDPEAWKIRNKEEDKKYEDAKKKFNENWRWIMPYVIKGGIDEEKLMKELNAEADEKYDDIINRTNELIGQITDASNLSVGAKGELNGIVYGTRGAVRIETIGAGGYNIQRFHFRTLIHKMKER